MSTRGVPLPEYEGIIPIGMRHQEANRLNRDLPARSLGLRVRVAQAHLEPSGVTGKIHDATLTNPQSLNLYVYVRDNPTTLTDPDGHAAWPGEIASFFRILACSMTNFSCSGQSSQVAANQTNDPQAKAQQQTNAANIPSKFVIETSKTENHGPYSVLYYQLENSKGQALTGSGYSVEEHISGQRPSHFETSEHTFARAARGEVSDRVGWLRGPGYSYTVYQTFTVKYGGKNYDLTTEFKHETIVHLTVIKHHRVYTYTNTVTDVVQ